MFRPLASALPASIPLAALFLPTTASAETLIDTIPAWSAWLGGGSALLLMLALALAVGSTAKEPRYPKVRHIAPMPLRDPGGSS